MATQNINLPVLIKADTEEQFVDLLINLTLNGECLGSPVILTEKSAIVYKSTLVEVIPAPLPPPSKQTYKLAETK